MRFINSDIKVQKEQVFLERVHQFFKETHSNTYTSFAGQLVILTTLLNARVEARLIYIWGAFSFLFWIGSVWAEYRFSSQTLTVENAVRLVIERSVAGILVVGTFGVSPFLLPENVEIIHEMFLFIILTAAISVSAIAYPVMPYYYLALNVVALFPITIYLFLKGDTTHHFLALVAFLWQVSILSKAWRVSKGTIEAIEVKEQLKIEIEHHKETKGKLKMMATHDDLTGLPNRRFILEHLELLLATCHRHNRELAILFIDLDKFKTVNDTHGHRAGDFLLKEIATRLSNEVRGSDVIARLGGDEFLIAYSEFESLENLNKISKRLLEALSVPVLLPNKTEVSVTGSIGTAIYPTDATTVDALIEIADNAMYGEKHARQSYAGGLNI